MTFAIPFDKRSAVVVALCACFAAAPVAQAQVIASSTFNANAEGWTVADLNFPAVGAPPPVLGTFAPTWSASGGNPGGHIFTGDPSGNVFYWSAPIAYLGNQSAAFGGSLAFDLAVAGAGFGTPPNFHQEDVVLVGGGRTLVYDTGFNPGPTSVVSWNSFSVGLGITGWRLNGLGGAAASTADMQAALGALSALYIRGEYLFGLDDIGRLDNVRLTGGQITSVPEPSSLMLLVAGGVALLLASRKRRNRVSNA